MSVTDETAEPGGGRPDLMRLYLDDVGRRHLPTPEEQTELARRVGLGDKAARDEMIAANLRLVVFWARRYQGRGVDLVDLVQEGALGLIHAVERFEWQRGFRFSTYASWWIRQSLQRAVLGASRTIRLPERAVAVAGAVEGDPDGEGGPASLPRVVASLDQPVADGSGLLGDLIASDGTAVEDEVSDEVSRAALRDAVDRLPEPERTVIRARFALSGDPPASLASTARELALGIRRVRQVEAVALRRLAVDIGVA